MHVYRFSPYLKIFIKNNNPARLLKNYYNRNVFMKASPKKVIMRGGTQKIDIYIIAFNKPDLIEAQIKFLKKNLKDDYRLIIADNSNKNSEEIEKVCTANEVSYIKLPLNKLNNSHSHGTALNYVMKNFVLRENTEYFGFLDHDCFLIKPLSIISKLEKQSFRGLLVDKIPVNLFGKNYNFAGKRRFTWPGCGFYRKELFKKGYNFLPVKKLIPLSFLDTGGGNRKYIYKYYNKNEMNFLNRTPYQGKLFTGGETIGNYFYHVGGSGHRDRINVSEIVKKLENIDSEKIFFSLLNGKNE